MNHDRRKFLTAAATVSTVAIAGCSTDDNGGNGNGTENGGTPGGDDPYPDDTKGKAPDSDEFRVIEARGQTRHLRDGEVFENVLIDLTTGGTYQLLSQSGSETVVRNVGFYGYSQSQGASEPLLLAGDPDGNTSRIEHVYVADGGSGQRSVFSPQSPDAVRISPAHAGHVEIHGCNVQGFPDTGFHHVDGEGTCTWERCYAGNHGKAAFRTRAEDVIRDCIVFNDGTTYGGGGETSSPNGRLVWSWPPGGVEIHDSHLDAGEYDYALAADPDAEGDSMRSGELEGRVDGPFEVADEVGSNPEISPPEGIPLTAIAAALGEAGEVHPEDLDNDTSEGTDPEADGDDGSDGNGTS